MSEQPFFYDTRCDGILVVYPGVPALHSGGFRLEESALLVVLIFLKIRLASR